MRTRAQYKHILGELPTEFLQELLTRYDWSYGELKRFRRVNSSWTKIIDTSPKLDAVLFRQNPVDGITIASHPPEQRAFHPYFDQLDFGRASQSGLWEIIGGNEKDEDIWEGVKRRVPCCHEQAMSPATTKLVISLGNEDYARAAGGVTVQHAIHHLVKHMRRRSTVWPTPSVTFKELHWDTFAGLLYVHPVWEEEQEDGTALDLIVLGNPFQNDDTPVQLFIDWHRRRQLVKSMSASIIATAEGSQSNNGCCIQ